MCGILFLTEGSGQPQLSRVFQDVPKRRALSNTASHTGLSPSHTEIVARSVCVACLCWDELYLWCVCVSWRFINLRAGAQIYICALKVTAQFQWLASKEKPACVFRVFIGSCYSAGSVYCTNPVARVHVWVPEGPEKLWQSLQCSCLEAQWWECCSLCCAIV